MVSNRRSWTSGASAPRLGTRPSLNGRKPDSSNPLLITAERPVSRAAKQGWGLVVRAKARGCTFHGRYLLSRQDQCVS
jgi:hypothetical protein